jgi:hypothetical protein
VQVTEHGHGVKSSEEWKQRIEKEQLQFATQKKERHDVEHLVMAL